MDTFDRNILRVLQVDSRSTLQDIGAAVGLSASPCWKRIRKLEESGVIQGYGVRVDAAALGYKDFVLVQVSLENHSDTILDEFARAIADIPEVIDASLVSGGYDCLLRVAVRDTRDFERFLRERLYPIKGIRQTHSSFVLRTIKQGQLPLGDEA